MTAAVTGARRARWTAASALVAALFVASQALLWLAYYGGGAKRLIGDEQSYQAFALAILGGGPWMPSSIWPPLQSLLLAAIYAAFGVHVLAAQLVQTLLFVGCALLLRGIWREVGGSVRATNIAAALFLVDPANAAYAHWLWPEVPHLFLVLLAFRLLLAVPASRARAAVAGACTGLALLAKSLLAGFWPMFLIAFVRREHPRFRIGAGRRVPRRARARHRSGALARLARIRPADDRRQLDLQPLDRPHRPLAQRLCRGHGRRDAARVSRQRRHAGATQRDLPRKGPRLRAGARHRDRARRSARSPVFSPVQR